MLQEAREGRNGHYLMHRGLVTEYLVITGTYLHNTTNKYSKKISTLAVVIQDLQLTCSFYMARHFTFTQSVKQSRLRAHSELNHKSLHAYNDGNNMTASLVRHDGVCRREVDMGDSKMVTHT